MEDGAKEKLERLRQQLAESESLVALEKQKAELSVEILETILLRVMALERRIDQLERS